MAQTFYQMEAKISIIRTQICMEQNGHLFYRHFVSEDISKPKNIMYSSHEPPFGLLKLCTSVFFCVKTLLYIFNVTATETCRTSFNVFVRIYVLQRICSQPYKFGNNCYLLQKESLDSKLKSRCLHLIWRLIIRILFSVCMQRHHIKICVFTSDMKNNI